MYMIGAGFKKFNWNISRTKTVFLTVFTYTIVFALYFLNIQNIGNCLLLEANGILPFLLTLLIFNMFKNVNIKNNMITKVISTLSSVSFLVYIIQEHDMIRYRYWDLFSILDYASSPLMILNFLLSLLTLWPIAFIIQKLFQLIVPSINKFYDKIYCILKQHKKVR